MDLASHLDLGEVSFCWLSKAALRKKLKILAVFTEEAQDRVTTNDWLLERGLECAIRQEQFDQVVEVVGVQQIHIAVHRWVDNALDEHPLALLLWSGRGNGLHDPLALPFGGVVAHIHHKVAQQSDLLTLINSFHGAKHRRSVGRELVAVGDRSNKTSGHPFAQLVPEAQLDVHRPAGVGATDLGIGAIGELAHHLALLSEVHRLDLVEHRLGKLHPCCARGRNSDRVAHFEVGVPDQGQLVLGAQQAKAGRDRWHDVS